MNEQEPFDSSDGSPLHGFHGEREESPRPTLPLAPSIAISREVGARGGEVARRLGKRLGWQVFDAEILGYTSQDANAQQHLLGELPADASDWISQRLEMMRSAGVLTNDVQFERVTRLILTLGAKGEAIFVGRGAGFVLPRETTLHVRLIAPLKDRIAYMSQWLRLPHTKAEEQVAAREEKRTEFLSRCLHLTDESMIYDLVLNSSSLGEELCSDLILQALACKEVNGRGSVPKARRFEKAAED